MSLPSLEEDFEDAYEHGPAGYVTTRPDGGIIRSNATFRRWTGFSSERLLELRFQDLLSIPGRIYYETHLGPLLTMQGAVNEIAVDILREDGQRLPCMINAACKKDDRGEVLLTRFTVFNATERRRYEQQLLEARRQAEASAQAKTELLAMLSHDIRTPLGSIVAVAHILEKTGLTAEQKSAVRILHSSATTMLGLVNQILEHSRLDAGALTLQERPFDLRRKVCDTVAEFQPLARNKDIYLQCAVEPDVPALVIGDAPKLGQVLGNLIGNALKFTERGGILVSVSVQTKQAGRVCLRIGVVDTGIGIPEHALHKIFEAYSQADENIRDRYGGTGLGLAISRKLLAAQNSELRVRSRVGEGTEFWFDLELALPIEATAP